MVDVELNISALASVDGAATLIAGPRMSAAEYDDVRRRLVLDACKWDPQVGDVSTLCPFPLIVSRGEWARLAADAERLAEETVRAEMFLLRMRRLQKVLGVPRRLRTALGRAAADGRDVSRAPVRVMRFDFHPTAAGWRVSEVNSDVPGGFAEASTFTWLVARHYSGLRPAGDPGDAWARALDGAAPPGPVGLLAAPGFMEDQQVVAHLAARLAELGRAGRVAGPEQLVWRDGWAHLRDERLAAVVRFYQVEWLTRLPRSCGWENLLGGGRTPVTNAGAAALTESKRFPLMWDALPIDVPTWRRLLPETRDPRDAPWRSDGGWLLKSAYCNTGDTVTAREWVDGRRWRRASWAARMRPGEWVAQRRFETAAVDTPAGRAYPCIGVYVIDGRAAGAYARLSRTPVVDYSAADVALLVREGSSDG